MDRRSCCCTATRRRMRCGIWSSPYWPKTSRSWRQPCGDTAIAPSLSEMRITRRTPSARWPDIVPTSHVFRTVGKDLATAYYHWFFFIQPYDLPETLIGAEPGYYLRNKLGGWGTSLDTFAPEALAEYERCFDAATIHASCEDYRASASIDLVHDEADLDEGRKVLCPLLALWGGQGVMERIYDVEAVWREYASHARGKPIDAGHFLAEERPAETTQELNTFLQEQSI